MAHVKRDKTKAPQRQTEQQALVEQARSIPEVARAMDAYARVAAFVPAAPPPAMKVRVASGGNAGL